MIQDNKERTQAKESFNNMQTAIRNVLDRIRIEEKAGKKLEPFSDTDFINPKPLDKTSIKIYAEKDREVNLIGLSVPGEQAMELLTKWGNSDKKTRENIAVGEWDLKVVFSVDRKKQGVDLLLEFFEKYLSQEVAKKIKESV